MPRSIVATTGLRTEGLRLQGTPLNEAGGVIARTPGGYTYPGVNVGGRIGVDIGDLGDAVASFHTHPRQPNNPLANRLNEAHSPLDRSQVRTDPQHRPAYILAPSGAVRVYELRPQGYYLRTVVGERLPGEIY